MANHHYPCNKTVKSTAPLQLPSSFQLPLGIRVATEISCTGSCTCTMHMLHVARIGVAWRIIVGWALESVSGLNVLK